MSSILGFNTHIRYLKDYTDFVAFNQRIAPAYNLAYVDNPAHLPYAKTFADSQQGKTVVRLWHSLDGAFFLRPEGVGDNRYYIASPQDYLDQYGAYAQGNMILNVLNEPSGYLDSASTTRLITWMSELLTIAARRKLQLCILNWSDRHPKLIDGQWDNAFDDIIKIAAGYPELFYVGVHMYGPDKLTEHLKGYFKRCETLGIQPNRVICSEFGLDTTGGADNGYKSRGWTGKQYADWQIGQVKSDLKPFIDSGKLVGLCTFCAGNSGGWQHFDIEPDMEYRTAIETASKMEELEPVTTYVKPVQPSPITIVPKPDNVIMGTNRVIQSFKGGQLYRHLRIEPRWDATDTAQVYKGTVIRVYDFPSEKGAVNKSGEIGTWKYVEKLDSEKQVIASGWMWVDNLTYISGATGTSEFPVVTPPPATGAPEPAENAGNSGLQPIVILTRADIQKQIAFRELEIAQLRDLLARTAA